MGIEICEQDYPWSLATADSGPKLGRIKRAVDSPVRSFLLDSDQWDILKVFGWLWLVRQGGLFGRFLDISRANDTK